MMNAQVVTTPSTVHKYAYLLIARSEFGMMMREILRSLSVHHTHLSSELQSVIRRTESFNCDLIIVDDTPTMPASLVLRELLRYPFASLTR